MTRVVRDSLVHSAVVLGLLGVAGCITTEDVRDEDYAIFRSRGAGYLRVSLDRNRYESNDEPPTRIASGTLTPDERERVEELSSDERMAHYEQTGAGDREACLSDPNAYALSTRTSLGGCWLREQVTDADTREMLDFMVPLLEKYVP